jgi:hypothetical protein
MINALSPTIIVRSLTLLIAIAAFFAVAVRSLNSAFDLWAVQGLVTFIVNGVIALLTVRSIFLWVYKLIRADLWWFPLLDGEWVGELRSNWPRVRTMMLAAKHERERFDALVDELSPDETSVTPLNVTIACSLLTIEMTVRIPGTERTSHAHFVRPQWRRPAAPQISYVYEQVDHGHVAVTDAQRHRGAAVLDYHQATGELRGEYWTNRQGSKGLNTAGVLTLRRA